MARWTRLARCWSWLPAFRAVAETEHLPRASELLDSSPPALSRALRQLERDLGEPLFHRHGRNLRLNHRGQVLLKALREGMEAVEEALLIEGEQSLEGEMRILSAGVATTAFLLPALERVRAQHPGLLPMVEGIMDDPVPRLLSGEVGLALQSLPREHGDLETVLLGEDRVGVYCGADHPLAGRRELTLEEVVAHPFVGPAPDARGVVPDGFPPRPPRQFALHVDQMRVGLEVCARSRLLAVLPEGLVKRSVLRPMLTRLPVESPGSAIPIYALHRKDPAARGPTHAVLAALREVIAEA